MISVLNVLLVVVLSLFIVTFYIVLYSCRIFFEMDPDAAKYMRTERKPGSIDVHPNVDAIVLNYEIDVQILGAKENVIHGEKKAMRKTIELPMLNSRTDCHTLAKEVINQCDLIHHSRLSEVEQLIYYLKKRKLHGGGKGSSKIAVIKGSHIPIRIDITGDGDKNVYDKTNGLNEANYNNLSDYIDLLYEGMNEKIKGANLIQYLARNPDNLEALAKNETFISAIGRTLREDWKKSISLSTNLVFTFFCFSMYSCFHEVILKCKVGSICMDMIDYELRRYDRWRAELTGADPPPDEGPIVIRRPPTCPPSSASMSEFPAMRSRIPEPVRPRSGNFSDVSVTSSNGNSIGNVMEGSSYDELTTSVESIDDQKLTEEQKAKRFRTLVKKQEHLLRIAFYLLLNIAEDETVEEKMSKRNIVGLLVKALERDNDDLNILVITFLKKLSIMQCNKDAMANYNIIEKLPKKLDSKWADVVHLTLKLIFNLSFDPRLRCKISKAGLMPKFISLLSDDRHQEIVLKILYQLSYDEENKPEFQDCIGLIIDMLLLNAGNDGDKIMVALCINLAHHPANTQQILKNNRFQSLMTRAFTYQDSMLMKMLRNMSDIHSTTSSFIEFVGDIAGAVVKSKEEDFVRECIGVLSNLNVPDLDWAEVFKHFDMVKWIKNTLSTNSTDPELILQVIVLLGTAATDEGCSKLLCETNILATLIELLKTHQEDDEIVLQIVYVFYVSLWHECNIDYIIEKTEAAAYLIDLLQDNNASVRRLSAACLNIISDRDAAWSERVRVERFRQHNAHWLHTIDQQQDDVEEGAADGDDELPPYLNTEYLSTAVVPPLTDLNDIQDNEIIGDHDLNYDYFATHHSTETLEDFEIEGM